MKKIITCLLFYFSISVFSQTKDEINLQRIKYKEYFYNAFNTDLETNKYNIYFSSGLELIYEEESLIKKESLLYTQSILSNPLMEKVRINQIYLTIKHLHKSFDSHFFDVLNQCGVSFIFFQFNNPCYFNKTIENKNLQYNYIINIEDLKKNENDFGEESIKSNISKL